MRMIQLSGIPNGKTIHAQTEQNPNSDLYDAYKLVKSRDGMQKALWVGKGNPNKEKLIAPLKQVATNPKVLKQSQKKVGKYNWLIGKDGDVHRDTLMKLITPKALSTLVKFNNEAFGIKAIYKDTLVAELPSKTVILVKYASAVIILIAMILHVAGITPWNSILQMVGAGGWIYVGYKCNERAIILNSSNLL